MVLSSKHFISPVWNLHRQYLGRIICPAEESLEAWGQDIERKAKKTAKKTKDGHLYWDDDLALEHSNHLAEDEVRYNLRVLLINSFFVACWASFEAELERCCKGVQKARGCSTPVKDVKGPVTGRAEKYCKMLSFEFPSDAPEWKEIHQYYGKSETKLYMKVDIFPVGNPPTGTSLITPKKRASSGNGAWIQRRNRWHLS